MISVEKKSPIFFNHSFDKKRLKALISWVFKKSGEEEALRVLDLLKETGFNNATKAGISIGLHDLTTPATKSWLISESQQSINTAYRDFNGAKITATERSQRIIDTWHRASESLSKQVVEYFGIYDTFNPVYIMALSGARGNFSQVRQLIGMRGLMADQQGKIVSFPIRSNLREGLTITEYFISCSGARKGLVDTALRTADTGYLTRRLVDVSHHVVVKRIRCNTERGIALRDLQSYNKILLSLKERLIGRVLAETIVEKDRVRLPHDVRVCVANSRVARHECLIAKKDREITPALALQITRHRNQVLIRSPLTCSFTHEVCQLCYGWSISQGSLVSLGDAVGVIAAQSIGEPGTQLTMRTFHTGGVFSGDLLQEVRAPHAGRIEFSQAFQGLLIRTGHGRIAFLSKTSGSLILNDLDNLHHVHDQSSGSDSPRVSQVYQAEFSKTENNKQEILAENLSEGTKSTLKESQNLQKNKLPDSTIIPIQPFTMLFVRQGERVEMNQLLAEFSIQNKEGNQPIKTEQTLFAELSGKIIEDCSGKTYIKYLKESSLLLDYLRDYMSRWADYSYHATLDKAHTNLKSTDLTPSYPVSASSQVSPSAFTFSASHPQESLVNASPKPCIAKGDVYKTDRIRLPCVARHELGKQACDSQKEYNVSDRCFTNASQIERSSKKQNFTQNSFYKNFGESNKKLFKNKENKPKIQDISKIQLLPSYRSEDLETDLFRQIEPVQSGRLGFLKILSTRIGATFDYTCPIKSKNLENYLQNSLFLSQQQQKFKQIDLLSFGAIPSFKASTYTPDYSTSSVYKNTFENSLFYPVGTKRIRKFRDSRNFKKHEVLSTGFIRQKNSSIPTKYLHPAFVKENRFVLQTIAEYGDIVDEEYKTKTKIL